MDTSLFLDVARVAARTEWAHGLLRAAAGASGTLFFVLVTAISLLRARAGAFGAGGARPVAAVTWTGFGAAAAYGIARALEALVSRTPPGAALAHVTVLVSPAGGHSLPAAAAALAGAVLTGLWLAGDWALAGVATLGGLVVGFACVYDATAYPSDAAAGLGTGIVVAGLGWLVARDALTAGVLVLAHSRAGFVVGATAGQASRRAQPGPAAHASVLAATGAVRLLEDAAVRPVPPAARNVRPATDAAVTGPQRPPVERRAVAPPIERGAAGDAMGRRGITILPREPN